MIYLIDTHQTQILGCANFPYSLSYRIKLKKYIYILIIFFKRDIEFFTNSIYKFITCGRRVMSIWTFKGNTLSYYNLNIENPKV